jgi:DNA-binding transcriptional LysR family regulator
MRFDLSDLRLFVAVVRSGSITRGAQGMNLALASASQRISGMEAMLGVTLLERTRRSVLPTPAGTVLMRHAQDILVRADQMHGELNGFSQGLRGRIPLLSNTSALLGLLPPVLRSFLLAHPGLDIEVDERPSTDIVRIIAEGGAELGIVADVVDPGALQLHRLVDDPLVMVAAAAHPLAGRGQVAFTEIMRQPLVGLVDAALETHLADHASRRGVVLHHRIRLRSIGAIGQMVRDGIGIAILPQTATGDIGDPALRIVRLTDAWARRRLAICLRGAETLTPGARLLLDHIRGHGDNAEPSHGGT